MREEKPEAVTGQKSGHGCTGRRRKKVAKQQKVRYSNQQYPVARVGGRPAGSCTVDVEAPFLLCRLLPRSSDIPVPVVSSLATWSCRYWGPCRHIQQTPNKAFVWKNNRFLISLPPSTPSLSYIYKRLMGKDIKVAFVYGLLWKIYFQLMLTYPLNIFDLIYTKYAYPNCENRVQ